MILQMASKLQCVFPIWMSRQRREQLPCCNQLWYWDVVASAFCTIFCKCEGSNKCNEYKRGWAWKRKEIDGHELFMLVKEWMWFYSFEGKIKYKAEKRLHSEMFQNQFQLSFDEYSVYVLKYNNYYYCSDFPKLFSSSWTRKFNAKIILITNFSSSRVAGICTSFTWRISRKTINGLHSQSYALFIRWGFHAHVFMCNYFPLMTNKRYSDKISQEYTNSVRFQTL